MKKNNEIYGIIGLGRFGRALAKTLANEGKEILVLDNQIEKINEASEYTENAFLIENLSKENLIKTGIQDCDTVFVCIGTQIDTSILTTLNVIELGVEKVIAKATSEEQGNVLKKLGAEVVYPEKDMAERLAKRICEPHILEYISLSNDIDITEIKLSDKVDNMTIQELDIRKKFGLNIIALKKGEEITIEISPQMKLNKEDTLTIVGKKENIDKFEDYLQ